MQTVATMLGLSISTVAARATAIRAMAIMFGVCGTVSDFETLILKTGMAGEIYGFTCKPKRVEIFLK